GKLILRHVEVAEPHKTTATRELGHSPERIACPHGVAEALDGIRDGLLVEAKRRRQAERVHRAVCQPVATAQGLRHRVADAETRQGQSFAGVCGTLEERLSGPDLAPVL